MSATNTILLMCGTCMGVVLIVAVVVYAVHWGLSRMLYGRYHKEFLQEERENHRRFRRSKETLERQKYGRPRR